MAKDKKPRKIQIVNRRAEHEYHFIKRYEAGIVLHGTEVKSLRDGTGNLTDSFCFFKDNELYVKSMFVAEYKDGTYNNHETRRLRKLLLRRTELNMLARKSTEKGYTIVPIRIFFSERGFAKLEIALAQGKKEYDKRETLKERDQKRELDQLKKIRL
jgi:SsrA-binding protein